MPPTQLTLEQLYDSMRALAPAKLLGTKLFQTHAHAGLFPTGIAREQLVSAVTELVVYGERCRLALERLGQLTPIPLTNIPALEFGL
jgi:hypothetical protein